MIYRRMGRTGLQLSGLGFGAWATFGTRIGRSEARELLAQAFDRGVNLFDNSESYAHGEAERIMGDALADLRLPRDAWCMSSKVFFGSVAQPRPTQRGLSIKHVTEACNQSLQRLRVDHLDLYFCHRPDPETPIGETVQAMDRLVRQGKVLYWGTSEWPALDIAAACRFAAEHGLCAPTVEQPQYNLLHRQRVEVEYAALYSEFGIGTTTWSPLASGLLAGKYQQGVPEHSRWATPGYEWLQRELAGSDGAQTRTRVQAFLDIAQQIGESPAQLAIAWCLKNPQVSCVLLGATTPAQLEHNLHALSLLEQLDETLCRRLEQALS